MKTLNIYHTTDQNIDMNDEKYQGSIMYIEEPIRIYLISPRGGNWNLDDQTYDMLLSVAKHKHLYITKFEDSMIKTIADNINNLTDYQRSLIQVAIKSRNLDYITINSSHGRLLAYPNSGFVIDFTSDSSDMKALDHLSQIKTFDFVLYRKKYNCLPKEIDILSLGYWLKDDTYIKVGD